MLKFLKNYLSFSFFLFSALNASIIASENTSEESEAIRYIRIQDSIPLIYESLSFEAIKDDFKEGVFQWHEKALEELNSIDKEANSRKGGKSESKSRKGDSQERSSNLATFSVTICYGDEEQRAEFNPYVFFSRANIKGISDNTLQYLREKGKVPYVMEKFFKKVTLPPNDEAYRKQIIEFFGFKQKLKEEDVRRISSLFDYLTEQVRQEEKQKETNSRLKREEERKELSGHARKEEEQKESLELQRNYQTTVKLIEQEKKHKKLLTSILRMGTGGFDEETNKIAAEILGATADKLFEDFHHYFNHSEQVARMFINYIPDIDDYRELDEAYLSESDRSSESISQIRTHLKLLSTSLEEATQILDTKEDLPEKAAKMLAHNSKSKKVFSKIIENLPLFLAQYQENSERFETASASYIEAIMAQPWQKLLPPLGKNFKDLMRIRIDLATHKFPCQVCCGTYWHDINHKKQLQKAILGCIIKAQMHKLKYASEEIEGRVIQDVSQFPSIQETNKPNDYDKLSSSTSKGKMKAKNVEYEVKESEGRESEEIKITLDTLEKIKIGLKKGHIKQNFPNLESIEVLISSLRTV
jgi:hypothetical protein